MTPDVVLGAIETMQADYGVKPSLMLFDYMQLIPVDNYRERVQQVTEVPIRIKELALRIGAPAVVGVQAARKVDDRQEQIPTMNDAQWASSIEQTCDKIFGLWMPSKTHRLGQLIELGEETMPVTENLLIMRMLKQRFDRGRYTWPLHFDPALIQLAGMETREVAL
jgi:hypothetical protein